MTNDVLIYTTLIKNGVPHQNALNIIAQARYETNDYTSNVFRENKNLFGYKFVGQKKYVVGAGTSAPSQDAQGNKDGGIYAKYPTIENSVLEIIAYYKRRFKAQNITELQGWQSIQTLENKASKLKAWGYFGQTASQYLKGMQAKIKNIKLEKNA